MTAGGKVHEVSHSGRQFKLRTQLFINNKYVDAVSGKTFETLCPNDNTVICAVAEGDRADIALAVDAATAAFDGWSKVAPAERGRLMNKLADLLEARVQEFAAVETLDNGKPLAETSNADIPLSVACFRYYAGWADKIHGKTIPVDGGYFCYTRREPVGVIGQIIPWNFPLLMAAWKLGPALVTGNTVVLKPAEQTPLTALLLGELIAEAGFPAGVVNIVPGFGPTAGGGLVDHPGVQKVAFTGSVEVGKIIMAGAAKTLKRCSLELGGKSPNIIFEDADIDAAVEAANRAIFFNQGEVCTAGSRLLVQESIYDEVVKKSVARAEKMKVGNPFDADTEMGAQVSLEQHKRILEYIEHGKAGGARLVTGGSALPGTKGYFVQPTIFADVNSSHKIYQEEIFGPVLSIAKFKTVEDAIHMANETEFGLGAAVWSNDIKKVFKVSNAIRAGTVWANCYHNYSIAAPFGGYKSSGVGREKGEAVLELYTETKCVFIKE